MKEHKKLYKHGKLWVTATIFAATLGIVVGTGQAQAATEPATTTPAVQQVNQTTTGSNQNGRETNQQPSATTLTSQQAAPTDQTNINPNDHGNYGWLDQTKLNSDGSLNVSGWHATNESQGRQYHYIIAFDPIRRTEIARQDVTESAANRPDVARAHPVAGAVSRAVLNCRFMAV
ncbi:KxYKxGKxW signal peptide domain-containing protein [uncultured Limosilactobacillus sp.]|uniref:KxYKxGKxW signal peptide domain-containing protein n=1 Tax=uncultured Limosilactobacillus sp. TaxID=2837629 RepID=UPI00259A3187|nr:KxYKxGKxW signal peptide domain-containing protein [uncultured Limosilactobacillus sp.]